MKSIEQEYLDMTDAAREVCIHLNWTPRRGFWQSKDNLAKRYQANGRALFEKGSTRIQIDEIAAAVGRTYDEVGSLPLCRRPVGREDPQRMTPAAYKSERQRRGLSQAALAALVGVSRGCINYREAGHDRYPITREAWLAVQSLPLPKKPKRPKKRANQALSESHEQ
jgi:hypothetical protein